MSMRLECVDDEIAMTYDDQSVCVGEQMEGVVTYGDDWVNFYFQCLSSVEILRDLQHNMNQLYDTLDFPSITRTTAYCNGSPCAAKYLKDNKWYRARLIDTSYSIVHFVDYGNKQMTNLENVKPLTRSLAELVPPLAYLCKLANFQNPLLPSFVESSDLISITILSKTEPYEVSVHVRGRQDIADSNAGMTNGHTAAADSLSRRGQDGYSRRTNAAGLTLPPLRQSRSAVNGRLGLTDDQETAEDDIDRIKGQNRRARLTNTGGKLAISGACGFISEMFATCGQVNLEGAYRHLTLQLNSQETTLNNGALSVDNLTRIFRQGDRVICNARYEDPLPNGLVNKLSKPPSGYYIVTDMQMANNSRVLISHAVVTFVSQEGAILYVRNLDQSVYALLSVFPESVKSLPDSIQRGRSVLVRAMPAEQFPDIQVTSEWIAQSVEILGNVVEFQGYMYFVREMYSVLITDGGVGFGYVFVQNEFVEDSNVPQREWFGTRALYRACLDVPDKENFRFGNRWKGLVVRLLPEHPKGNYRYAGIYKPSSYGEPASFGGGGKKMADGDDAEDNFELPEEVLREMRLMGRDSIGVNRLRDPTKAKPAFIPESTDNLLNEPEDQQLVSLAASAAASDRSQTHHSDGGINEPVVRQVTPTLSNMTNGEAASSAPNDFLRPINPALLLEDINGGLPTSAQASSQPSAIDDLLGLSLPNAILSSTSVAGNRELKSETIITSPVDLNSRNNCRLSSTNDMTASSVNRNVDAASAAGVVWHKEAMAADACQSLDKSASNKLEKSLSVSINNNSSPSYFDDLLGLWEGGDQIQTPTLSNLIDQQRQQQANLSYAIHSNLYADQNSLNQQLRIDRSKVGVACSSGLLPVASVATAKTTLDQASQPDQEYLLKAELDALRKEPEALTKVLQWVITLPSGVQQRFYALLARTTTG